MIITNDIFIHLSRCPKAGFLYTKKGHLAESEDKLRHFREQDMKEKVFAIIKSYLGDGDNITFNKEFVGKSGIAARADILFESEKGTQLLGVFYSNEQPNWIEIINLAYTYYVIVEAGFKIESVAYITANKICKREDELTIEDLKLKNCTRDITGRIKQVKQKIDYFKNTLRRNSTPANKIDNYCIRPGVCPFINHCEHEEFPEENSIMKLRGVNFYRKLQLKWRNIKDMSQPLPKNFTIEPETVNQIYILQSKKIHKDKKEIKSWINDVSAKQFVWFWDFETVTSFSPLCSNPETFIQYPYLYTLYYKDLKKSTHGHLVELLDSGINSENLRNFVRTLINNLSYPTTGAIVISNLKKAKECILNLQNACPQYKDELEKISKSFADIRSIFTEYFYYDPKFKTSLYLKDIVPIMCPDISYEKLQYKTGVQAQLGYLSILCDKQPQISSSLKEYSTMDAKSLMRTYEFLQSI